MAVIANNKRASANGTGTKNKQFAPVSASLQSRVVLALQYDPAKTAVVENVLDLITSADAAAAKYGFGSQMHRAVLRQDEAHEMSVQVWAIPIPVPTSGPASATGTITFAVNADGAGTHTFYIAGQKITISAADLATPTEQGDALVTEITNTPALPVTAANVTGVVTLTSKWQDTTADDITIKYNLLQAESDLAPGGTTVAIVAMSSGAGTSDVTAALAAISSSSTWFTDLVTPYGDVTTFDEVEAVVGNPDSFTKLYGKLNYRPFTNWGANTDPGSSALTAAVVIGTARKETDAVNDYVQAPDYIEIPFEIASLICGFVAGRADSNPASHYEKIIVPTLFGPEDITQDYTAGDSGYTNRDTALKAGLSTLYVHEGNVVLGDIASFYHPNGVVNPAFLFEVNKRKTWNMAKDVIADKNDPDRQGSVIVENAEAASDQSKATDEDLERARIVALSDQWAKKGYLFASIFTKQNMIVDINSENPDRIDRTIPCILSGNVRIRDDEIQLGRDVTIVNLVISS